MNLIKKSFFLALTLCPLFYTPTAHTLFYYQKTRTVTYTRPTFLGLNWGMHDDIINLSRQIASYTITIENTQGRKTISSYTVQEKNYEKAVQKCMRICATCMPSTRIIITPEVTLGDSQKHVLKKIKTKQLSKNLRVRGDQLESIEKKLTKICAPSNVFKSIEEPDHYLFVFLSIALIGTVVCSLFGGGFFFILM